MFADILSLIARLRAQSSTIEFFIAERPNEAENRPQKLGNPRNVGRNELPKKKCSSSV
jgi:hypothetical protein